MLNEEFFFFFFELLAGFSAIMIGLLFLTVKSKNQIANMFLVLFLWCLSWLILTDIYLDYAEDNLFSVPEILNFDPVLFIIPSLFLYIIITINKSFNSWYLALFIPGILSNLFHIREGSILDIIFMLLFPLINLPLMIIAYMILVKHKKKVANYYSELEYKTLAWIKSIIITVLVLHFFILFSELVESFNDYLGLLFIFLENLTTLFIVYWIGYNGFFQAQLFRDNSTKKEIVLPEKETQKELILNEEFHEHFQYIKSKIKTEKLFQNSKLNLRILAFELGLKEKELSKLINQGSETNFYQFINRFRVDEFKNLLNSPKAKQMSILGLAQEAGFSSKSTFYTAFKTLEGMTPKEYESTLKQSE